VSLPTRRASRRRPLARALAAHGALAAALTAALTTALTVASRPAPLAAQPPIGGALADSVRDDRRFSFEARGPYRPEVPRPEALLGFRLGDRNTQFAEQERVLLAIAERAPDRVRVEEIGPRTRGGACGSTSCRAPRTSRGSMRSAPTSTG
jgi:hypothetical protein